MTKGIDYVATLLEDMNDKFDGVVEAVGQLQDTVKTLATKDELAEVKADVQIIKAVVTATNRDVANLDTRVTVLEQAR